jgi:Rha family phage regulatory protein
MQNQLVHQSGDRLIVTSLEISNHFGRQHKNVLQAIDNLECSEKFRRLNFQPSTYNNGQNKAQTMYEITRDGFTFLCMGFTGQQAAAWKERYIDAFNQMEAALRGNPPAQQQQLGLAREIGQLRDMLNTQQTMILSLFERLDASRRGHLRAQVRLTSVLERESRLSAALEKRQARDSIIQMEAEGIPRDVICLTTGRTLNHVRQVVFQAKQAGLFPALEYPQGAGRGVPGGDAATPAKGGAA